MSAEKSDKQQWSARQMSLILSNPVICSVSLSYLLQQVGDCLDVMIRLGDLAHSV